ncbi:MAG: ABC transporter ATP-binding protein [Deltaproteobacteria bacterium]|nr:ABC transporter ATP-binding protein [Deltaproteobacteria bacterium]
MAFLELDGIGKSYRHGHAVTEVLRDIHLCVNEGEFVAIVGFSGSGKTTLISTLAGLISPDAGEVRLRGRAITGPGADRGVVFQSYSLFPWLTVSGNVALAVDARSPRLSHQQRVIEVARYVAMVGLAHAAERHPGALSGGMRQRVALARALATRPEILLLDEPLSALDALTRANMQDGLEEIRRRERRTIVLVTNDVDEALLLADRIVALTPAPAATLGPEFRVDIPRPRDRRAINHDPAYRKLRGAITQYLLGLAASRTVPGDEALRVPTAVPNTAARVAPLPPSDAPAPVVREAAHPGTAANLGKFVEFFQVTKTYPTPKGPLTVVDRIDLDIAKGEFVTLIGHSGCGKSTLLSMVAGLTDVSGGGIVLDGREVVSAGPDRGVVFQAPNLLPWLTVRENVSLGVDRVYPHEGAAERRDITEYYLSRVGLADTLDRKPGELSNGMKQRVGLARAFALSPKLLLLDEPFGMLDSLTRWGLQEVLMEIWKRTHVTALCVTHDIDEAILLADRVVMMTNGPHARIGKVMKVDLPRPRTRKMLLDHERYYDYREELLTFLEEHEQQRAARAA